MPIQRSLFGVTEQALLNFPVLNLGEKKKGKNNFFGAKVLAVIGKSFVYFKIKLFLAE